MEQHYQQQQQQQHSPDQIVEIPNDPVPQPPSQSQSRQPRPLDSPPDTTIVHLPAGQLYHRYPSTSVASTRASTFGTIHKPTTLRSIVCWTLFIIIVAILSFLIFVFVLYIALRPKAPRFSITDFVVNESNRNGVGKCRIWLKADNPNAHLGLYVHHHGGRGYAALYINQMEIAKGVPPDVYLRKRNTTSFEVLLEGLRDGASRKIWGVEMRFKMDVKVKLKLWLMKAWDMKMDVRCTFRASRQVSNGTTNVLSQLCKDKIKF